MHIAVAQGDPQPGVRRRLGRVGNDAIVGGIPHNSVASGKHGARVECAQPSVQPAQFGPLQRCGSCNGAFDPPAEIIDRLPVAGDAAARIGPRNDAGSLMQAQPACVEGAGKRYIKPIARVGDEAGQRADFRRSQFGGR